MGFVPFERLGVKLVVGAFDRREKGGGGEREGRREKEMGASDEAAAEE